MQRLQRKSKHRTNEPKSAKGSTGQPRAQRRRSEPVGTTTESRGTRGRRPRSAPFPLNHPFFSEVLSGEGRWAQGQATGLEPQG